MRLNCINCRLTGKDDVYNTIHRRHAACKRRDKRQGRARKQTGSQNATTIRVKLCESVEHRKTITKGEATTLVSAPCHTHAVSKRLPQNANLAVAGWTEKGVQTKQMQNPLSTDASKVMYIGQ